MLAGLDAALLLLGVWAPVSTENLPDLHGVLMVFGFLGTVIALERAVALAKPAGFLAPGLLGLGAIALLTPAPLIVGQLGLTAGSLVLTVLRSEEHTSELQSRFDLVCRLLLEKKKIKN